jgi:hypothetical protein
LRSKLRKRLTCAVAIVGVLAAGVAMASSATQATDPATSAARPAPALGKRVNLHPLSGTVTVRVPNGRSFFLREPRQVPNGSEVDTREGRALLVSQGARGESQRAELSAGLVRIRQFARTDPSNPSSPRRVRGLTELVLTGGPSAEECEQQARSSASLRKRLRTSRARGRHRTRTSGVAGTVRGTSWDVVDECALVDTRVFSGKVLVENFGRRGPVVRRLVTRGLGRFRTRGRHSAATVRGG